MKTLSEIFDELVIEEVLLAGREIFKETSQVTK